jgi:hypothetical protein
MQVVLARVRLDLRRTSLIGPLPRILAGFGPNVRHYK